MQLNNFSGNVYLGDDTVDQIYLDGVALWTKEVINLSKPTQIAFLFDTTGSMNRSLTAMRALAIACAQMADELEGETQFALAGFKDENTAKSPDLDFTEINTFLKYIPTRTSGGGDLPEDGYGAIVHACENFSWDPAYNHSVFLFTNAPSHQRGATRDAAIAQLNSINAGFYYGDINDSGYNAVATKTNGFRFTSIDDFTDQIQTLSIS